jgi:ribosomal protein L24
MGTKKKYKKWIMVIEMATEEMKINPKNLMVMDMDMATEEMKINPKNLMVMDMATEKGIQRKRIMDMDTDILMATEEDMATVQ